MKEIALTQGKVALVDDEDYERANTFRWYAAKQPNGVWYAQRQIRVAKNKQRTQLMHRFILETQPGRDTDHRNHDGLDNRRENLRDCSTAQNMMNMRKAQNTSSTFKGVSRNNRHERWCAHIKHGGKLIRLGEFVNEEDAARAYDAAAKKYFGEFAHLNFQNSLEAK